MGDSGISIDCNNPASVAEVDGETALFLTPGKFPEKIFLRPNNLIIYEDHDGYQTGEHGNWHKWTKSDGTQLLSLTFHYIM